MGHRWRATAILLTSLIGAVPCVAETVKARVLEVKQNKNEARVDVAGQSRTYRVNDQSLYRVLRPGRLVVITAELVAGRHTIVHAESAAQEGRVESLDYSGRVVIRDYESNSRGTYYLDSGVRGNLRVGDTIRFDVEERGSRSVITRWTHRGGSGGGPGGGGGNFYSDYGRVSSVDASRGRITIQMASSGRRQTFDVADRNVLDFVRSGDRVNFDYRREWGRMVITQLRRGAEPR
jgi:Cu/Ag efflux protein CusF